MTTTLEFGQRQCPLAKTVAVKPAGSLMPESSAEGAVSVDGADGLVPDPSCPDPPQAATIAASTAAGSALNGVIRVLTR